MDQQTSTPLLENPSVPAAFCCTADHCLPRMCDEGMSDTMNNYSQRQTHMASTSQINARRWISIGLASAMLAQRIADIEVNQLVYTFIIIKGTELSKRRRGKDGSMSVKRRRRWSDIEPALVTGSQMDKQLEGLHHVRRQRGTAKRHRYVTPYFIIHPANNCQFSAGCYQPGITLANYSFLFSNN